jgi:hypothetical protein
MRRGDQQIQRCHPGSTAVGVTHGVRVAAVLQQDAQDLDGVAG